MSWIPWAFHAEQWIPAFVTSSIVAAVLFIAQAFSKSQIEKYVSHKYDVKFEELKSQIRGRERVLEHKIKERDEQLSLLRSGALSGMASRHSALSSRRLQAVEKIWLSVVEQNKLKYLSVATVSLRLDVISKEISSSSRDSDAIRKFMDLHSRIYGLDDYKAPLDAASERPFVSAKIWALYTCRNQIMILSFARFTAARHGIDPEGMTKTEDIIKDVKSVVPEFAQYIDEHGVSALPYLVEPIEAKLLSELGVLLDGDEGDNRHIAQAASIINKTINYVTEGVAADQLPAEIRKKIIIDTLIV